MKKRQQRAGDHGGQTRTRNKRAKEKRAKNTREEMIDETEIEEPKSRFLERLSLGLTLVVVSVFAIFAGYLVGQYASSWASGPGGRPTDRGSATVSVATAPQSSQSTAGTSSTTSSTAPTSSSSTSSSSSSTSSGTASSGAASSAGSTSSAAASSQTASSTTAQLSVTSSPSSGSQSTSTPVLYRVQVGAYADRDQAVRQVDALKTATPPIPDAFIVYDDTQRVYRVQVGSFSSQARAEEFAKDMVARGFDAIIAR